MKTALVTGGNKGIGYAICMGLAENGFRVFMGARDIKRGEEALSKLHKAGHSQIELIQLNVSSEPSVQDAVKKISGLISSLDVLVNNAGVFQDEKATALSVPPEIIQSTFITNTLGPLLLTRALVPMLERAKAAQVINMSSGMGQLSDMQGGSPAYRISKTALNAVTRMLAVELSAQRISVNSVCPGWVKTEMGGSKAPRTVEQGADTPIWLATGQFGKSGHFLRDRETIEW